MKVGTLIHPEWLARSLLNPSPGKILAPSIEKCIAAGADHIELTGEIFTLATPSINEWLRQEINEVLFAYKEDYGLSFSVHLPTMGGLDLSTSIEEIRKASLATMRNLYEITRTLSPENYVLHIAGMFQEATGGVFTGNATSSLRHLLMENVRNSLDDMLTYLAPDKICVENLPSFPMDLLTPLIEERELSVCLDIGHLTLRGDSFENFLDKFQSRIREVHIHDVKRRSYGQNILAQIDHHALGQGDLNFNNILTGLHHAGFSGPLVLETLHDKEMSSIAILKNIVQIKKYNTDPGMS